MNRPILPIGALIALVLAAVLTILDYDRADGASPSTSQQRTLPACLSDEGESAFACVWMASAMGNGRGHSFRIYQDGRVKPISHARAFVLLGECDSGGPLYC